VEAAEAVRTQARAARDEWHKARAEVAQAIRDGAQGDLGVKEAFQRHEGLIPKVREVLTTELDRVLRVLDERQRQALADVLERGRPHFI
jgi:hypothetical protein